MAKLLIEEVPLPAAKAKGGKRTSKYFNDDIKEAATALGAAPQSFLVPSIEGVTPANLQMNVSYYLNKWGKTLMNDQNEPAPKAYTVRIVEGGVRVWLKA